MTAVEWLKRELIKRFKRNQLHYTDSEWCFDMIKKLSEQAKEIEKQQQGYSKEDMEEYAEFCIKCDRRGLPCIIVKDWYKNYKK